MTSEGNLLLCDFGTAYLSDKALSSLDMKNHKQRSESEETEAQTFVGSKDYVSPEVLKSLGAKQGADIWSLACIIYQLFTGETPFQSTSEIGTFENIINVSYDLPDTIPEDAKDLIRRMLKFKPEERLGSGSASESLTINDLKAHPFFKDIDWGNLTSEDSPLL